MQYENRLPPEGINVTRVHPLKQFAQLAIGALVMVVLVVIVLRVSGGWLAKRIPFEFEIAVVKQLDVDFGNNTDYPQIAAYLNNLADRVGSYMDLPDGMQISVHYNDDAIFNAFATVGGNLMFYKSLLDEMPDENTLAMVMAHEIAHVLHRDPVAALGGGVASTLAVLALTGSTGTNMASSVLGSAGTITGIQFSRGMEVAADESALAALNRMYGHVNGATALFDMFSAQHGTEKRTSNVLEGFLSTHPQDSDRVNTVQELAAANNWLTEGKLTDLPENYTRWLAP